ncbi:MAG: Dienelactone hydrolase family protein, partial [uncultured Friedmanniella sp.]
GDRGDRHPPRRPAGCPRPAGRPRPVAGGGDGPRGLGPRRRAAAAGRPVGLRRLRGAGSRPVRRRPDSALHEIDVPGVEVPHRAALRAHPALPGAPAGGPAGQRQGRGDRVLHGRWVRPAGLLRRFRRQRRQLRDGARGRGGGAPRLLPDGRQLRRQGQVADRGRAAAAGRLGEQRGALRPRGVPDRRAQLPQRRTECATAAAAADAAQPRRPGTGRRCGRVGSDRDVLRHPSGRRAVAEPV